MEIDGGIHLVHNLVTVDAFVLDLEANLRLTSISQFKYTSKLIVQLLLGAVFVMNFQLIPKLCRKTSLISGRLMFSVNPESICNFTSAALQMTSFFFIILTTP